MKIRARRRLLVAALLGSAILPSAAFADSFSSKGQLGLEFRGFLPETDNVQDTNLSLAGRLEAKYKNNPFQAEVRLFGRVDSRDNERSVLFFEDAWLQYKDDGFSLRIGYQTENWSATEVFHPADVLNARNLDGDVQYPEKLGELMAVARMKFDSGNIQFYIMPLFQEPIFPSANSRLSFVPPGVTLGPALVLHRDGTVDESPWEMQWAIRLEKQWEKLDLTLHALGQVDRQVPALFIDPATFTPHLVYTPVTQFGGTAQYAAGSFLLKAEGAYRIFESPNNSAIGPLPDRDYGQAVLGLEYSLPHDNGSESTLLVEGQAVLGIDDDVLPFLFFRHHALAGWRYAWNDVPGSTLLTTAIVDVTAPDKLIFGAEYSRRLGESWRAVAGFRMQNLPADDPSNVTGISVLHAANQGYLKLTRFF